MELVSLDELLARSDFITLHTPITNETRHIINRTNLAKMKAGVRIVNCARGGLVDEEALYEALVQGRVGGAALDVFTQEPPTGNPLLTLPNVICTPHLGASSVQAQANVARAIASQILDYLQYGRHPQCRELSFHAPQRLREDSPLSDAGRKAGAASRGNSAPPFSGWRSNTGEATCRKSTSNR